MFAGYLNPLVIEQLGEGACIVVSMTVSDDNGLNEHAWDPHLLQVLRAVWRWVNHDAFTVYPDDESSCLSFRIEA